MYKCSISAPQCFLGFGTGSIVITHDFQNKSSYTFLGADDCYSTPDNKGYPNCNDYLAGEDKFRVSEVECWTL